VGFSADGFTLVSGSNDHTIKLWDINTGKHIQTLRGNSGLVYSVTFSCDGSTLTSGSNDHTIRIWDIKTGRELQTLICHPHSVTSVANSSPTDGHPIPVSSKKSDQTQSYLDTRVS
jgi:WD40 repeat protein